MLGDALEAQAEWLGENLLERVATYRIIGNLRVGGIGFPG